MLWVRGAGIFLFVCICVTSTLVTLRHCLFNIDHVQIGRHTPEDMCGLHDTSIPHSIKYGDFPCVVQPSRVVYNITDEQCMGETYTAMGRSLSKMCASMTSDHGFWLGSWDKVYYSRAWVRTASRALSTPSHTHSGSTEKGSIDALHTDIVIAQDLCDPKNKNLYGLP
jgi:hypothetical protein